MLDSPLTETQELLYRSEYVKRHIRYVRKLHKEDWDMQTVRQETLGQNIVVQDKMPSIIAE
jgi:hypothetical protein